MSNMFGLLIQFFITFCFVFGSFQLYGKPLQINTRAKSAILINAETGKVLFEKEGYKKLSPASVTKVATCLAALESGIDFDKEVTCPHEILLKMTRQKKIDSGYNDPPYVLEPDAMSYGIYSGEKLTFRDLIYGMMVVSGNDAANVLAYHLSENRIDGFMGLVNYTLRKVGCKNSHFLNPHGLYYPGHFTTAYDLALLSMKAIQNDDFVEIVSSVTYDRPKTNKQPARTIWNLNKLLRKGRFHYPKAFGIKTGYHASAGVTFIGAAKDDQRTLINVVLGCKSYDEAFTDSILMFEKAFAEKKLARKLLNSQDSVYLAQVPRAKESVQAVLEKDLYYEYFPSEEEKIFPKISWNDLQMPIKKGQALGEILVSNDVGEVILRAPLFAKEDVKYSTGYKIKKYILKSLLAAFVIGGMALLSYFVWRLYMWLKPFLRAFSKN